MRNLKRALSLAMATFMLLGMMVVGASAATSYDDFSDKDKIVNTEAVNTMVSLGVIDGRTSGDFDPTGIVTRGEMAKLITFMLNGGKDPVLGSLTASFSDAKGVWSENYIAYCANLGILNGYGDGTVKPNATVTGTEAAKMILTALGYRSDIEGLTGGLWAVNTNSLANKIDLYDNLGSLNPNEGLNRDNAAQMIYNGVQADEVEYRNNYGEYAGVIYAQPKGTILVNRFKVMKVEGVVLANDVLALEGNPVQTGKASIRTNNVFKDNNGNYVSSTDIYTVEIPTEMVGTRVVIYVKFQNHLSPNAVNSVVIGDPISSAKNNIFESAAKMKDASKVKDALKGTGLTIVTSGSNKTQVVTINETGTSAAVAAIATSGVQAKPGVLQRFIDHNNDGNLDYILQINPALSKVSTYNTKDEKLTLSGIGSVDFADIIGHEDLAKDDYVLVYKYSDTYVITEAETADGDVTSYNKSNDKITVDGTAYAVGSGNNKTTDLDAPIATADNLADMVDNGYTLYLDPHGNILGAVETSGTIGNFAVITASDGKATPGFSSGQVKLLMADGTTGRYDVDLLASAKKWNATVNSGSNSEKERKMAGVLLTDITNTIVSYTMNDDKTVTIGRPAYMNTTKYSTATGAMTGSDKFYSSTSSYTIGSTKVVADSNTVFFVQDDSGYTAVAGLGKMPAKGADPVGNTSVIYNITSGSNVAKAVYFRVAGTFTSTANFAYISDKFSKSVESGDTVYSYPVVLEDGTVSTLKTKDDANWAEGNVYSYTTDAKGYVTFDDTTGAVNNVMVSFVGNGAVDLVDADNTAVRKDSLPLANNAKIWNVEDTDDIFDTSLSKLSVVCLIKNDDGAIKTGFVMEVRDDEQTAAPTAGSVTVTGGGTVGTALDKDGGSTTFTTNGSGNTLKAGITFPSTQKATYSISKSGDVKGTVPATPTDNTVTSGSEITFYTSTAETEVGGQVRITFTLSDKDAGSTKGDRVITFEYTVSAPKAAAPTGVALAEGTTTGIAPVGTTVALTEGGSVDATVTDYIDDGASKANTVKLTATASSSTVKSVVLKKDGVAVAGYANGGDITISGTGGTYVYEVTMQETSKLDATYTYTVVIAATQKKAAAPTVKIEAADAKGLTITATTLNVGANTASATGFVDGATDCVKFTVTDAGGAASTVTLGGAYTAGDAVDVGAAIGTVNYVLVVTTTLTGHETVTATYNVALTVAT